MKLRDYQSTAVGGVFSQWDKVQSTLGCCATGGGKTQIFCEVIRRRLPGRALILAHRTELVSQAVNRLRSFGMSADIEQGELVAGTSLWSHPVVVATPQTLYSRNFSRLKRFKPGYFSTIICDEAHHYSGAPAFEGVVRHLIQDQNTKLLGVTATPDRADNIAMSKVFKSVAFKVEIVDLITLGYLVGINQHLVKIQSLDLSECRKTQSGDLNEEDVARVVEYEKTLLGMADATLATVGTKRTVVFATSVKQAERMAEIFNRHNPDCAACVFGDTHPRTRAEILERFSTGRLQICVNVGVLTEGYDNPGIEAVVMARPTLSRSLYAQMCGRGTRPLTGVVEAVAEDSPELRRAAIASSSKPDLLVLDFVGNSSRFKLVTSADILGGRISEEAKTRAKKRVEERGSGNILDELAIAEQELRDQEEARKRSGIKAKSIFSLTYVDPFDVFTKRATYWQRRVQNTPLTENQRRAMVRNKMNPDDYATPQEAVAEYQRRTAATEYQVRALVARGYPESKARLLRKWEVAKVIDGLPNGHAAPIKPVPAPAPKKLFIHEEPDLPFDLCSTTKPTP